MNKIFLGINALNEEIHIADCINCRGIAYKVLRQLDWQSTYNVRYHTKYN